MVNVLHILLGVLVAASLVTIVAYAVIFVSIAAWTAVGHGRSSRRDPLAVELDELLAELWALDCGRLPAGAPRARRFP